MHGAHILKHAQAMLPAGDRGLEIVPVKMSSGGAACVSTISLKVQRSVSLMCLWHRRRGEGSQRQPPEGETRAFHTVHPWALMTNRLCLMRFYLPHPTSGIRIRFLSFENPRGQRISD